MTNSSNTTASSIVKVEEFNRPEYIQEELASLIRKKRDFGDAIGNALANSLGTALSSAGSIFLGNIASNLVGIVVERINPNSNYNRIGRLENQLFTMKQNFDIQNEVLKGTLTQLESMAELVKKQVKKLENLSRDFPKFTWIATVLANKIFAAGMDLSKIADAAEEGKVDTKAMARILGLAELKHIRMKDTRMHSMVKLAQNIVRFNFTIRVNSPDTLVYRVFGFLHWNNLTETPEYLEYRGSEYLIYNETSNYIKAVEDPRDTVVSDECVELDGEDPSLSKWSTQQANLKLGDYSKISTCYG